MWVSRVSPDEPRPALPPEIEILTNFIAIQQRPTNDVIAIRFQAPLTNNDQMW